MIKRLLVVCILLLSTLLEVKSQTYGNEWINYSQNYYKIKIAKNGVYRIDSLTMASAGIPVGPGGIDPNNFQLFNKGAQQKIYIEGESDGVFNSSDFIEFYAEKNDGTLDSLLYINYSFLPNPYYSLINDTAVYYLTWNSSVTNSRMSVEPVSSFAGFSPDNYFFKDEVLELHSGYYEGQTDYVGSTDSRYTKSEGWFDGNVIDLGNSAVYGLNTPNAFLSGPNATIKSVVLGASKDPNILGNDHELKIELNTGLLVDTTFLGYEANRFIYNVPVSMLSSSNTFKFTSVNSGFTSNRTVVSYINVKYPHTFDLEGKNEFLLYVPENSIQPKSFLTISNFNATGNTHLYDLTNGKRIDVVQNGTLDSVLVANSLGEKKCYITSDGFINAIASLQPVTPSAKFTDFSTFAVDSAYVIVTHKSLMTEALDYKIYRNANMYGGNHNVIIADIDELYDQFAYGIAKSPLSVRGFSNYLLNTYPSAPQNLFLIGKGYHMQLSRNNATFYAADLVPSFGNPSSDNLLTAGLTGGVVEPSIPTGRLAASMPAEVSIYLDKIKQYEDRSTNPPAEWMKHILHFGGGTTSLEQTNFKTYLNGYKATLEDTLFGGYVSDFFKTSSAPIQINTSDTLRTFMNEGVSIMTFFGHASASGFDQSIDDINSYNPTPGHYPFMLTNGCYSGDIHSYERSTSENYVINQNRGMIGYLASVGLGVPHALNAFSSQFYKQTSLTNYGKSVGSNIKRTVGFIELSSLADPVMMSVCNEMTLHGDPALIINAHENPDYRITNNDVYFDLTSEVDTFTIYAVRTNLGRASGDTIFTEALRTFPDGNTQSYKIFTPAPRFKDTVAIRIPFDFSRDIGLNKVRITLDFFNRVDELDETNNSTSPDINFIIIGGDVVPVYPYQFAIIPKDTVTLKASTTDLFAPSRTYVFQIDTTDSFLNPLDTGMVTAIGGVISWKPSFNFSDTVVYYLRVSPDSISPTSGYKWRESSFQYIAGKRGWEQAHFFQFKDNDYEYVKYNRPLRQFEFADDFKNLQCKDGLSPYISWIDVAYKINGSLEYVSSWAIPGFTIAVFNPVSNISVKSIAQGPAIGLSQFGSVTYAAAGTEENACDFFDRDFSSPSSPYLDSVARAKITNFIQNDIPLGYNVLAYTQENHSIPSYEEDLYQAFEMLGSTKIRTVPAQRSYILFGKKTTGGIIPAKEIIADSINSIIQLDTALISNWDEGSISSPVIGPALSWDSLSWKQHTLDGTTTDDSIVVRLIGIKTNGTEDVLKNFTTTELNVGNLGIYAPASTYPRVRMVAYMKDNTLNTPPQLDRWQIIYTPVPEGAINPPLGYSAIDTVQEGDNVVIQLPFQNISEYSFNDSLLVTYWIEDANRVNHPLSSKLKKNLLAPNEVIIDTVNVNTASYPGSNVLWVEVNPLDPMDTLDQPKTQLEQYHFNNIARIPFQVTTDKINPLLDVTFDGVHILNSDIISSKPNILVQLKDENQFLALNDTGDFKLFLQSPSSGIAQRIYFGTMMSFIPAVLPSNSCKINFTPTLYEDGKYQLIVQAKDKSDNQSGAIDYKISFEVINKATITEVMNYPNPFSTATHFVFTLTGSEVPTYFKIQILTVTGKVVKEITNDELGLIHIGRNVTDYAWNGRDEFGDQLANGVYLYRVVTTLNGDNIEKRGTAADQYFKKGFGKMYLMR
ncbi:MAG TPA: C25 family cysteine peptidase [Bacteroidia bacterium]